MGRRGTIGAMLLAATALPLSAQTPSFGDSAAVGAFLDGVIATQMIQFRIPQAAVAVVSGGRVLYAKGYGFANREKREPVDPATTMFHIGSLGKLLTWTAVMQLVEQGKLDLDRDVNQYLGTFPLKASFAAPITLRHLMTHTAGFQEGLLGYFIGNDSTHVRSIDETLRHHVPARVRPPGQLASYSNYGASLAGLIVERASGEPFAHYIEKHVYQPLGIRYATFREPVPPALRPYAAVGYEPEDGRFVPEPPEIDGGFAPSGGTVMATLDVARFMLAHLGGGAYQGGRILEPKTVELMQTTGFRHGTLPGMGLGFIEANFNGHRIVGHDGDSKDFHVGMWLVPEAGAGLYVAYGASGGDVGREQLARAFFDRFFPRTSPAPPAAPAPLPLERYAGSYRMIRMNYTDVDKVIWAFLPPFTIDPLPSGRLLLRGGVGPDAEPGEFGSIGGNEFREVDGDRTIGFGVDSSGRVSHLFTSPTVDYERVPWAEGRTFWMVALIGSAIVLLFALIGSGYRRREIAALPPSERRANRLEAITAVWLFATVIVVGVILVGYGQSLLERIPLAFKVALVLPLGFAVLSVLLFVGAVRAWIGRMSTFGWRVRHSLVAIAAVLVTWFCYQWNLLGWHFG